MAKAPTPGLAGSTHFPLSAPNVRGRKEPKADRGWGYISEPAPAAATEAAPVAAPVAAVAKTPVQHRPRTFEKMCSRHRHADGRIGFTYRELCPALGLAAESLKAARIDPGRLSVNSVLQMAALMGEDPILVMNEILAEIKRNGPKRKAEAARFARAGREREKALARAQAQA